MTPETFLAEVVQPNTADAINSPGDVRAIANAILTVDALAGIIHAHGKGAGRPEIAEHRGDEDYREALAKVSLSYRVLRDLAASLKHGELTHKRQKLLPRLLHGPKALATVPNMIGLLRCDDPIDGDIVVIECDVKSGYARASSVVADTFRMLERVVRGEAARTDDDDRATFAMDDED